MCCYRPVCTRKAVMDISSLNIKKILIIDLAFIGDVILATDQSGKGALANSGNYHAYGTSYGGNCPDESLCGRNDCL